MLTSYTGNAKEITIPDSVTEISERAFCENETLESVIIPGTVKKIGEYAFSETYISNVVLTNGLVEICEGAFAFNAFMKKIEIPDTVEKIAEGAFASCPSAIDENGCLVIRNVMCYFRKIGENISAMVPDGATVIDKFAFLSDNDIIGVETTESVVEIREKAFYGCENLERVILPNDSVYIHPNAFEDSEKVMIVAHSGSSAEKFAKENGIKFEKLLTEEELKAIKLA